MKRIISDLKNYFWIWPDGLLWKYSRKTTVRSRRKKFDLFMTIMAPKPEETILDIGVSESSSIGTNYLELWYPYPERITALTNKDEKLYEDFKKRFPSVHLVFGDGRDLRFSHNEFDVVFSNAVVEHVGEYEKQKCFVRELLRVGKRVFITTPNYWFPIESHTLIPFAHWLPEKLKCAVYKMLGRGFFADKNNLNLVSMKQFLQCFPEDVTVKIYKQRIFGITASLIAVVKKA